MTETSHFSGHCCSRHYLVSDAIPWLEVAMEQTPRGTVRVCFQDEPEKFSEGVTLRDALNDLTGMPVTHYVLIPAG
ncbi:MAG TPA: hypothetical protein VN519_06505 [Bryobacteraceae bacterium]|nr:hypothetical protein [Bryobacteraceae bacterium]